LNRENFSSPIRVIFEKAAVIFRIRGVKWPRVRVKLEYSKSEQLRNAREDREEALRILKERIKSLEKTLEPLTPRILESFMRLNGGIVIYN